ncbi:MAG: hypothetical protein ACRC20_06250 [Segniliparus sp.]|uniref:hypothetical protein n=1 Tax=Segniliparus sp. TaxID=2804064 RepID=UPI003F3C3AE8
MTRALLDALNPAVLGELAQAMRTKAQKYEPEQSQFPRRLRFPGGGEEFTGRASDALQQRAGLVGRTYGDTTHILGNAAGQLDQAQGFIADSRKTARDFIQGVEDKDVTLGTNDGKMWNCGKPFQVADDFAVTVKPGSVPSGAPYQIGQLVQMMADTFAEDVKRLVAQLEDLGTTWAGKIKDALDLSKLALNPKGQPYAPYDPRKNAHELAKAIADGVRDVPSDPRELKNLWDQLSETEKNEIYARHHDIGNHNGIPFDPEDHRGRDYYNRKNLKDIIEQKQREWDALRLSQPMVPIGMGQGEQYEKDWAAWQEKCKTVQHELDGYRNVQATLDRSLDPKTGQQDPNKPPRFLGLLDEKGHAALSVGNPDLASNLVTA